MSDLKKRYENLKSQIVVLKERRRVYQERMAQEMRKLSDMGFSSLEEAEKYITLNSGDLKMRERDLSVQVNDALEQVRILMEKTDELT